MTRVSTGLGIRRRLGRLAVYGLALLAAFYLAAPFYWLVASSFMYDAEAVSIPVHLVPEKPTLEHWRDYLFPKPPTERANIGAATARVYRRGIFNSLVVASWVTLANLVFGTLAAYSLVRLRLIGVSALMLFYLGSRSVPAVAILIPMFILVQEFGLLDTRLAVILAHITFTLPFTIWILRGYFQTVPIDLEEAARVDGCGRIQALVRVFLPVAVPGLVAAGIFSFMLSWVEFLFALLFTATDKAKTVTVMASAFTSDVDVSWTVIATGGVLAVLPPLLLVLMFQKYIIAGLVGGAVKG
ncbi:MAG: carbohydrate ABC transporter permease [Candidatus Rokubacteria bacterium]|nr:carbohydrate ABC transporter permease [Candidatus Rokubacteria bacterium]